MESSGNELLALNNVMGDNVMVVSWWKIVHSIAE